MFNMMSVLEYAQDVNKTVNEILNLCKKLNIPVNNEDDMLNEDYITELDNTIQLEEEIDLEYEEELIEKGYQTTKYYLKQSLVEKKKIIGAVYQKIYKKIIFLKRKQKARRRYKFKTKETTTNDY